jgi:hypothetical protein
MSNIAAGLKKQPATALAWIYDDGGRAAAGFKGEAGDCVARAIAIATDRPYGEVYSALKSASRNYASVHRDWIAKRIAFAPTPRYGVAPEVYRPYLLALGWNWTATMQIGSGCRVHLRADELPTGRLMVQVSRHLVAVIDGVIHDTHDSSRGGTRCVYGFYQPAWVDWPAEGAVS